MSQEIASKPMVHGQASYRLGAMLVALLYGFVLSQLPNEEYNDYANYLTYAETSAFILLSYWDQGLLPLLSNEPVWLIINIVLSSFLSPEEVVRCIIFVSAFIVSWFVLLRDPKNFVWLLVFLLLPNVVKNHLIHLRQGLAIAVFLSAWSLPSGILRIILLTITPFIHSSFFFIVLLMGVVVIMQRLHLGFDVLFVVLALLGAGVGLGLGWLATMLGARQANEYNFVPENISGLGFILWGTVLLLYILQGKKFVRQHAFEVGVLILYMIFYWTIEVAARVFESGLILILLAGLSLTHWRLIAFKAAVILVMFVLAWSMRFSEPAMGFGVS